MNKDKPDIFVDALASQIDAIRRAAFDECIAIVTNTWLTVSVGKVKLEYQSEYERNKVISALEAARDATEKPRSDKGHHHRVAGVLQEDVDEAEN